MALNKREKTLLAVTGSLVLVVAAAFVLAGGGGSAGQLRAERDKNAQELSKLQAEATRPQEAKAHLDAWKKRALPLDEKAAQSLYQNWLRQTWKRVGLQVKDAKPGNARPAKGPDKTLVYLSLPFTFKGTWTLDQLARFLFEFYSAGYMHKVQSLNIKPTEDGKVLDLDFTIEVLLLPGAERSDKAKEKPERPLPASLADYQKSIVGRNLFAPYKETPPPRVVRDDPRKKIVRPPDPPLKPPPYDHTKETIVSGIVVGADGKPQVWLRVKTADEIIKSCQGERFQSSKFPEVRGTVVWIGVQEQKVEIAVDGKRRRLGKGDSLREGEVVTQ
jgi:hypothetical protein